MKMVQAYIPDQLLVNRQPFCMRCVPDSEPRPLMKMVQAYLPDQLLVNRQPFYTNCFLGYEMSPLVCKWSKHTSQTN